MKKYHYVYTITDTKPSSSHYLYIGVRSSDVSPYEDIRYMGSCKLLKEHIALGDIDDFIKEVISIWDSREEAVREEIRLHNKYDVGNNPAFYNRVKQTSTKFDSSNLTGALNHFFGKHHSEEQKNIWKKSRKGTRTGAENSFYGKTHTADAKSKISESWNINREERCAKISEAQKRNNAKIKTIIIYDSNGTMMYTVSSGFKRFLRENNLPWSFIQSYQNDGEPIYENPSPKVRIKDEFKKYKGWYAIRIE